MSWLDLEFFHRSMIHFQEQQEGSDESIANLGCHTSSAHSFCIGDHL